jgi:phenylacetate-coenzyme A ligase PaaK-like adenylate-forming protein
MSSNRPPVCEPLVFPLPAAPSRIAIIGGRFSEAKNIRDFDSADIHSLTAWRPEALVAPLADALALAEFAPGLQLSTAMIVLTAIGAEHLNSEHLNPEHLTDDARDRLWDAFGVPIFEQLRSWDGAVIARECEAHAGLHIAHDSTIPHREPEGEILLTLFNSKRPGLKARTGLIGEIVECECECGSGVPRLRNLTSVSDPVLEAE